MQQGHVQDPFVGFQVFGVEIGQERVGADNPPAGCNSICHVDELVWEELVEVFEEGGLQQLTVQGSHAIDFMGPNNAKICHPDAFWTAFFNDGQ